ncbi:polyribonucleotide nucleotidyltransferase [Candidatus Falkowbacteria bacterium RIFOXYB2_FULL_34_18]|uniref:Polyribonucleotide nucleotidyltransferase n=1 Tax=Candidatus Falkowbacteria bacterium RIFOXYD2_FULL_34_120 TaxID=1798007 RepID=A0A1F5TQ80_9BACT|nr:MAG: polyribonucleotide nucleotidyltransferase [Candidatus Falkowbacteria bacterium RIFOXYB2_FULL_34_18]OGF29415.1 MAG: polyribonucleotide nucleotidyltransferase [Candidatus Falkowbacteria bacterium RIFOXYC12_FULL_34_55]OGF36728.1 MAG: polyribonucleotide nucleotidyltransferase [Candidatus Falkowbacteria bacterium RIFOXYC2_FULL_34_220]OGF38941.1 MAG: polyribonucleotide nucleotidyltransferase [Candidatus Falkowbacteria bacterium RIFOXYD12_FULL_34_57]OGF41133.1 MAG: polyribonucleotide nucleotid
MEKEKIFSTNWLGRTLTFKTGKLALQASAAVIVQYGDTVVLATVVESKEEKDASWFPLMVDFEERLYAGGIIKGSQWIKREGRPTDEAILAGRMIDRSIRPLFDDSSRREVQVVVTILATDKENDHDIVALIGASAALSISGVKWNGPIAGIRIGRINGQLIYNPTINEKKESDLDLVVAGNTETIIQIEAGANEVKEEDMYQAIVSAKEKMAPVIDLINKLKKEVPTTKREEKENILKTSEEKELEEKRKQGIEVAKKWLKENVNKILFDKTFYLKQERKAAVSEIKEQLKKYLVNQKINPTLIQDIINKTIDEAVDSEITKELIENKRRVDGRGITDIRALSADINVLPRVHGSGLFSRGETQIMSVVTLAGPGLAQSLEGLGGSGEKRYMHHYNFASFSVGETGFMRGPGRREIGHGALAEKALAPVLPSKEDFPYTIRVVSETLGSNGSSSMGATCGSTLALMQAGVPIKKAVAGVAVGLASYNDMSAWQVITDIQDLEDGKGGMDFKITGTSDGITAIQLDTKTLGLNNEIIKEALKQGYEGRIKILEAIKTTIPEPNKELSPYAPRITSFYIDPEKIREVIGPGGKIINAIIGDSEITIDIEDDGLVMVCGADQEITKEAVKKIKDITRELQAGEKFKGKVVRLMDFGAFIEILPGRDGMVHVSKMAPYRVGRPGDLLNIGDEVCVKIEEIDEQGRTNLSMVGIVENEELWKNQKGKQEGGGFGGGFRGNDRGGGRGNFRDRRPNSNFKPQNPRPNNLKK